MVDPAHRVVVQDEAADPPIRGEEAGLGFYLLGGEHPGDRRERRVASEQLEVAAELLDAVDLPAPLHLDGQGRALRVAGEQVDGADGGRILAPDEPAALPEQVDLVGEEGLEMGLDAGLLQAGVEPELVREVVEDLVNNILAACRMRGK